MRRFALMSRSAFSKEKPIRASFRKILKAWLDHRLYTLEPSPVLRRAAKHRIQTVRDA